MFFATIGATQVTEQPDLVEGDVELLAELPAERLDRGLAELDAAADCTVEAEVPHAVERLGEQHVAVLDRQPDRDVPDAPHHATLPPVRVREVRTMHAIRSVVALAIVFLGLGFLLTAGGSVWTIPTPDGTGVNFAAGFTYMGAMAVGVVGIALGVAALVTVARAAKRVVH